MPKIVTIKDPGSLNVPAQKKLARTSDGVLWATYHRSDGTHNQIYVSYSDDEGDTWTEEQVSDNSSAAQDRSCIAIDSNDDIHVAWRGAGVGTYTTKNQVQYAKRDSEADPGEEWDTQELVTDVDGTQSTLTMAICSDNNIHLTWSGQGTGSDTSNYDIHYRKKTSTWQSVELITDGSNAQFNSNIAIDSDDNIHLVWNGRGYDDYTAQNQILYRKRTTTWGTLVQLTNIDASQTRPSIAIDSDDNIHVVWRGAGWGTYTARVSILYREYDGSWQDTEILHNVDYGFNANPSVAIDKDDNLYVVWDGRGLGSNPNTGNIYLRKRTDSWQNIVLITDEDTTRRYPSPVYANNDKSIPASGFAMAAEIPAGVATYYGSDDLWWESGPRVSTKPATNPTQRSVTLNGELDSIGEEDDVDVFFRYRKGTEGDWIETDKQPVLEAGTFDQDLDDLDSNSLYQFKAVVEWDGGEEEAEGSVLDFTTYAIGGTCTLGGTGVEGAVVRLKPQDRPIIYSGDAEITGDSVDVVINEIFLETSYLVFSNTSTNSSNNIERSICTGEILNSTTLRFKKQPGNTTGTLNIKWQVVELGSLGKVQQKTGTLSELTETLTLDEEFNRDTTFIICRSVGSDTTTAQRFMITAELHETDNDKIVISKDIVTNAGNYVIQVVDLKGEETTTDSNGRYAFGFDNEKYLDDKYEVTVEYKDGETKYNAKSLWDVDPTDL